MTEAGTLSLGIVKRIGDNVRFPMVGPGRRPADFRVSQGCTLSRWRRKA